MDFDQVGEQTSNRMLMKIRGEVAYGDPLRSRARRDRAECAISRAGEAGPRTRDLVLQARRRRHCHDDRWMRDVGAGFGAGSDLADESVVFAPVTDMQIRLEPVARKKLESRGQCGNGLIGGCGGIEAIEYAQQIAAVEVGL